MGGILLIILILLLIFGLPQLSGNWGLHQWGYGPSGIIGVILIVVIILALTGRL